MDKKMICTTDHVFGRRWYPGQICYLSQLQQIGPNVPLKYWADINSVEAKEVNPAGMKEKEALRQHIVSSYGVIPPDGATFAQLKSIIEKQQKRAGASGRDAQGGIVTHPSRTGPAPDPLAGT